MAKYINNAPDAPESPDPFSQVAVFGSLAFVSGQLPICRQSSVLVGDTVAEQGEQVLKNITGVLRHIGLDFSQVLMLRIQLVDSGASSEINRVVRHWLNGTRPSCTISGVSALPLGALVQIEAIAVDDNIESLKYPFGADAENAFPVAGEC